MVIERSAPLHWWPVGETQWNTAFYICSLWKECPLDWWSAGRLSPLQIQLAKMIIGVSAYLSTSQTLCKETPINPKVLRNPGWDRLVSTYVGSKMNQKIAILHEPKMAVGI